MIGTIHTGHKGKISVNHLDCGIGDIVDIIIPTKDGRGYSERGELVKIEALDEDKDSYSYN